MGSWIWQSLFFIFISTVKPFDNFLETSSSPMQYYNNLGMKTQKMVLKNN